MNADEVIQFFENQHRKPAPAWHTVARIYFILSGPLLLGAVCLSLYVDCPLTGWTLMPEALLFSLLNIYFAVMFLLNQAAIRGAPGRMARMLRDGKNEIAWLYIETIATYHQPTPLPELHFHFTNRLAGRVDAPLDTLNRLLDYFAGTFPDISTGYETRLALRFLFQPKYLKTNPVRHRQVRETVFSVVSADN